MAEETTGNGATPPAKKAKSAAKRQEQVEQAQQRLAAQEARAAKSINSIVGDETYGNLQQENRVVMRHAIALNIDSFRAAPEDFVARPTRDYPQLRAVAAPFLSVIIPNFNGKRFLATVFNALRAQSLRDFEIILADDASSDDSVAFTEANYPEVRLLVNRSNLGFARNCNMAADAARGRVVVFLNNDTEPEATWLEELVKVIVTNPRAAIVSSKLLLFSERNKIHSAGDLLGSNGIPRNRGVWEIDRGQYDSQPQIFSGCGGAVAYRKDIWSALGGFDDDFWMYLEDVDFAFRAQLEGYEAVFAPKARVYHHLSATGGGTMASYYVGRNTLWMIVKNMPRGLLIRNLPQIALAQLQVTIDALRNIQGEAAQARLRGQLAGLLGLPKILAKRKVIQPRRQIEDVELARKLS